MTIAACKCARECVCTCACVCAYVCIYVLFTELGALEIEGFAKLFSPTSTQAKAFWCHEGEEARTLSVVLVGALSVQNESQDLTMGYLLPGDLCGELELCGQRIRNNSVRAIVPSLIAEVDFEAMTQFIEGLGLKRARKVSNIIALFMLEHVKQDKIRLEEQDRHKLQFIRRSKRRGAFCATLTSEKYTNQGPMSGQSHRSSAAGSTMQASSPLGKLARGESRAKILLPESSVSDSTYSASETGNEKTEGLIERNTVPIAKTHNRETLNSYNETLQATFESNRLFIQMEEKLAKKVRISLHAVQVKEGDIMIAKGDNCEAFYVLHSGEVGVYAEVEPSMMPSAQGGYNSDEYDVHTIEESPAMASPAIHPLKHQETLHVGGELNLSEPPMPKKGATEASVPDGMIEYTLKGTPSVTCFESGGCIQVRRRKRSQKSDPNAKRVALVERLTRGAAFGENGLVSGAPGNVTICAMCDTTLLVIGRERFADLRLRFEQTRYYSLKTIVEKTPYARHLSMENVCKMVDGAKLRDFVDGSVILCETNQLNDECFTVISGCAAQIKTHRHAESYTGGDELKPHTKIVKRFVEGQTFADVALEDPIIEDDVSKVRMSPTFVSVGATTCLVISRSIYNSLIGMSLFQW